MAHLCTKSIRIAYFVLASISLTMSKRQSNVTSHINAYLCVTGKESYFMEDNAENKSIT